MGRRSSKAARPRTADPPPGPLRTPPADPAPGQRPHLLSLRGAAQAQRRKAGLAPGSAVYTGDPREGVVRLDLIAFGPDALVETRGLATGLPPAPDDPLAVHWYDLQGIHDAPMVSGLCEAFGLHPLAIEDVLNPAGRAKLEPWPGCVFLRLAVVQPLGGRDPNNHDLPALGYEQVSLVQGERWLLSFQEREGDVWDPLRSRLRAGGGRIRQRGTDYLLHGLLDAVVDRYFVALEAFEDCADELEGMIQDDEARDLPRRIYALRSELMTLRRALWPLRELVAGLLRGEGALVDEATVPYFRDLNDHVSQALDALDASRDRLVGLLELHVAMTGHRMNEVMKTLTIVATIFIPLTFLVGVYGMNFDSMPELHWRWGYPASWVVMVAAGLGMALWMRSRRWL